MGLVTGGFHLLHASPERIERTADYLIGLAPMIVAPCHCTGADATETLRNLLGHSFMAVSSRIVLDL